EQGTFSAAGYYPSVAFNPLTNFPMIAYYDITNGTLKFAEKTSTGWVKITLDNQSDTGYYPVLLVDERHNAMYIIYYSPGAGEMRGLVRALNGSAWEGPVTLATDSRGVRPAVILTPEGRLQVSFYDEAKGDLLVTEVGA